MKKLGFTLAEVLITLVIIGIIAAITIPALMNNVDREEFKVKYKKALSVMNQALNKEYALEGNNALTKVVNNTPEFAKNWQGLAAIMSKHTNIIKVLEKSDIKNNIPVYAGSSKYFFVTTDGMIFGIPDIQKDSCPLDVDLNLSDNNYPPSCGTGFVDVNGNNGPNLDQNTTGANYSQLTKKPNDRFLFSVFENQVMPGFTRLSVETNIIYGRQIK